MALDRVESTSEHAVRLFGVRAERGGTTTVQTGDWTLAAGLHGLVTGPSGCGKTTLLHLIAGLETADTGSMSVLGHDPASLSQRQRDRFRARAIGLVFQDFHLLAGLTAEDNLRLARWLAGRETDRTSARALLGRLGIDHLAGRLPHQLSQGEKQRVAIARAVMNRPRLIIADEPTSALDDDNAARVLDLLRAEADAHGASLLVASHDRRIRHGFSEVLALESPRT